MDLKSAGTLLYWCEGSKRERDRRVEFVNSDSKMIAIFMRYLRAEGIDESRIRVRMMIHTQDDEVRCRDHWKRVASVDDSNFLPTVVKRSSQVRRPLRYGTVAIRYNSVDLLRQIKRDISDLVKQLI